MAPEFTDLRPMLYTADLDATIAFYVSQLGFTLDERNDEWGWASLSRDQVALMIAKPNAHTPFDKSTFTGSFYFNTTDVDALWAAWKDKANVCYGLDTFAYGMREFAIYDNNGYLLQFGQPTHDE
jgi:catechol 2,3-dioxygenase-like lactoylglutathione lyase family enzyme